MSLDTGDIVRYHGEQFVVACVHDDVLYTMGNPSRTVPVSECELVTKASAEDRLALLRSMAGVASRMHRPVCARSRLEAMGSAE